MTVFVYGFFIPLFIFFSATGGGFFIKVAFYYGILFIFFSVSSYVVCIYIIYIYIYNVYIISI